MAGRMLRELCITKACAMFLRSSERSWLPGITMKTLYHWEDSRTRCQEILWRPAVTPDTYSLLEMHELWFDARCYRPADAGRIYQWVSRRDLHQKGTSYNLSLVIVGLHNEPMQIPMDVPRLLQLNCQRLRLSLHQYLVPAVPLSGSAAVTCV